MRSYKPVSVPTAAFVFCRYTIAILIWIALILKIKWIIVLVFFILLFSAILKVRKAPMILLYSYTINKIFPSKSELLDEKAMRFAHTLGSILALLSIVFLYFVNEKVGWIIVIVFAILKSISALGFCPASKLYSCATSGGCCALWRIRTNGNKINRILQTENLEPKVTKLSKFSVTKRKC